MGVDAVMMLRFKEKPEPKEIKRIQYELMHRFGRDFFMDKAFKDFIVERDSFWDGGDEKVVSGPGGWWYEWNTWCRYYGPGYERGPGLQIATIILYLLREFPAVDVWYGGDSGGPTGPWTEADALELLYHFLANGNHPYNGGWSVLGNASNIPVCPNREIPMTQYGFGFGGGWAAYTCDGCKHKVETGKKHE